jgi:hypothetical protein
MSREHMEELLDALRSHGWYLLSELEHPRASTDPFELEYEVVRWALSRADTATVIELEFPAFGDLGGPTDSLRDIHYCQVVGRDETLDFVKRTKPAWRRTLVEFVRHLGRERPTARSTLPGRAPR